MVTLIVTTSYIKLNLLLSMLYLTKDHYSEFIKSLEKPVLYLEGDKGANSILPVMKG